LECFEALDEPQLANLIILLPFPSDFGKFPDSDKRTSSAKSSETVENLEEYIPRRVDSNSMGPDHIIVFGTFVERELDDVACHTLRGESEQRSLQ
jgi:hypothetical protein